MNDFDPIVCDGIFGINARELHISENQLLVKEFV